ncbi:MAG: hypothetical protein NC910_01650 [Candidatus Omnitrophica bacterium]|nr:hypothetical protein [Candidatus Omnitrophota bacterium]
MAPIQQILLIGALTWLASDLLTPWVRRFAVSVGSVSKPADDRWGRRAIGRLGGLSIALGFMGTTIWLIPQDGRLIGFLLATLLMLGTGLWDDIRRLAPFSKLVLQIMAGCFVVLAGIQFQIPVFPWLGVPLTIGWLVLIMNAFNLMDNMDGLAGGIGVIAAIFCAWHAVRAGQWTGAALCASLAGATLGFLRHNLPPAKIFMGDSGSQILGLGLGTLTLMETWHTPARLLGILAIPTFLLAVPIFDTCFVTISRIIHGRHPFQGGTDHLSHRLGILGLTTRQVVFTLYGISAGFGMLSVVLAHQNPLAIAGVWLLSMGLLLLGGIYLAKVRVYAGPAEPAAESRTILIETMLFHKRRIAEVIIDFILICASFVTAHALRFEANLTPDLVALILKSLPWIILLKMFCLFSCGLYRGLWRYTSLPDLVNIFRAVTFGSMLSALVVLFLWRFEGYSRAVFFIDWLLLFVTISGSRVAERLLNEWILSLRRDAVPVLIVGAGDTGELVLRQLKQTEHGNRRVIGFLDDDPEMRGSRIHGIPILGNREELGVIVQTFGVREILIAIPRPPAQLLQQIQAYCEENGIGWMVATTLPTGESAAVPKE